MPTNGPVEQTIVENFTPEVVVLSFVLRNIRSDRDLIHSIEVLQWNRHYEVKKNQNALVEIDQHDCLRYGMRKLSYNHELCNEYYCRNYTLFDLSRFCGIVYFQIFC